jgi:thioredoxin 1
MAQVQHITEDQFKEKVLDSTTPAVVDFFANWCGPCKMIAPVLDKIAQEMDGKMNFYKIDCDTSPNLPSRLGIMGIPTLIVFSGGQEVDRLVGMMPQDQMKARFEQAVQSTVKAD